MNRLAPLLDRVRAEPGRRWSVAEMAREAAMSPRTFQRRFAEATGQAPGEWVAAVRVEEAKRLLEGTALPVEEVARLAGFGSTANLRLHFGRRHNKRLYRKRCRIENAFARLRNWRAIAMRYTRRGDLFLSAIALAAAVIFWLRW